MESKRKKVLRSQSKEKSQVLENRKAECDLQQFTKVRIPHLSISADVTNYCMSTVDHKFNLSSRLTKIY